MPLDKRNFANGGMDGDSEQKLVASNDYVYALNIRSGSTDGPNVGAIETVKGNTLTSFTFNCQINKVIGTWENKITAKVYYFVYSKYTIPIIPTDIFNLTHGIYEYDIATNTIAIVLQSNFLNFDPNHLITGISMVEGTIFFTDFLNDVRMVDTVKAKLYMRAITTIWTFDDNVFYPGNKLGFVSSLPHSFVVGDKVKIHQFDPFTFAQYNAAFTITAVPDTFNIITDGTFLGPTPPEGGTATLVNDGYPIDLKDEHLTLIRKPPNCQPNTLFGSDTTINFNYLTDKLFQFKYRYIYWNQQKSAWSPISNLIFPSNTCSVNVITVNNFISIEVLTSDSTVVKIEIAARQGNISDFFSIITLDKTLLSIEDNTTYSYSFYNDKVYNNIDLNQSIKLFDNIPRWAQALDSMEGERIGIANGVDGFDLPAIDTCTKIEFGNAPVNISTAKYNITGIVRISNYFQIQSDYNNYQPIHDLGGGYVWGGIGQLTHTPGVGTDYQQTIPLGGFIVYLAGTDYYAIAKQVNGGGGSQNSDGVYSSNTESKRNDIRDVIQHQNTKGEFTLTNVPVGKYIMRVASHFTTADDLANPDRAYQKTSTNTTQVGGVTGTECTLEVTQDGRFIVNGVDIGVDFEAGGTDTIVADLSDPRFNLRSNAVAGYVTDKDITTPIVTTADALADTRIHLAKVGGQFLVPSVGRFTTDHNGYFFVTGSQAKEFTIKQIPDSCLSGGNSLGNTALTILDYANPTVPYTPASGARCGLCIIRNNNNSVSLFSRTKITGNIKSNLSGLPVQDVGVICTHGGQDITGIDGAYNFYVYINTAASPTRNDNLLFSNGVANCQYSFNHNFENFNIQIVPTSDPPNLTPPYSGNYDANHPVIIEDILATSLGGEVVRALKRGGEYQTGIVYFDNYNRSTTTITKDGLKLRIPFYGKDVVGDPEAFKTCALYVQKAGRGRGSGISGGDFNSGLPIVSWSIKNDPPAWATHYQWVRTKDSAINRYLQFNPQEVVYVDDAGGVSTFAAGTQVKIKINLPDYKVRYPDSVLSYDFVGTDTLLIGDRIRFIKKGSVYYTQSFDFKIINYKDGYAYFYNSVALGQIDTTVLFEVYTPKLNSVDDIYYEVSQCYPIGINSLGFRYHSAGTNGQDQKKWIFTDNKFETGGFLGFVSNAPHNIVVGDIIRVVQNPGAAFPQYDRTFLVTGVPNVREVITDQPFLGSTPANGGTIYVDATGQFTTGDAYYRYRNIVTTSPTAIIPTFIDDVRVSDFYVSDYSDIGRPNRVDPDFRQVNRISTVWHSDKFIPETNINGLNSFFDTAFEAYDRSFGSIQKIFNYNHRLDVYQELKVGSIPIGLSLMIDNSGQGVVGLSSNVLNKIQYYQGEFGIGTHPECFAHYGFSRYFIDVARAAVLRLSTDGITPIDNIKMNNYFNNLCKALIGSNLPFNIYGTYDIKFDEYVMAISGNTAVPSQTISWNERVNRWSTFYSYLPENMVGAGNNILTFKAGQLYLHNSNSLYNNFYGVQYQSEVHVLSNADPSKVKVYNAVSEETPDAWEVYEITTSDGQLTKIDYSDFQLIEGLQYASIPFDVNTPNVINPIYNGDPIRSTVVLAKFRNNSTEFRKLFAVNFMIKGSERSNK